MANGHSKTQTITACIVPIISCRSGILDWRGKKRNELKRGARELQRKTPKLRHPRAGVRRLYTCGRKGVKDPEVSQR